MNFSKHVVNILCCFDPFQMFGLLLGISYLSIAKFVNELLKAQWSRLKFRTRKKMKIFLKFLVTNEHTKLNCSFLKSSFWKVWRNLSFSLKERQNSARFNRAAVTISKMTSRSCQDFAFHWEMLNCFKGSSLFFHTTTSNIQCSAYLSNKYWAVGCLEVFLKFATDSFPGLTSRVSLFNVNVLNQKDKVSLKTVEIKFRTYSR